MMTKDGWREVVLNAVSLHDAGDPSALDLLARLLTEQDQAKQELRTLGYGCTGMPWADVIREISRRET